MLYRICDNPDCVRAGQALPITEFYPNRVGKKLYHRNICKQCYNAANRVKHQQNMSNPDYQQARRASALQSYHKRKGTSE